MRESEALGLEHRFIPGTGTSDAGAASATTLLLLHGTGGDGDSLLQLGGTLVPGATLLSPTGNVRERGAPRFFRRLAEGVFDFEDLHYRTDELARFVRDASALYGFSLDRVVAVGYSNGANIGASLLLKHPGLLAGAVLFRAMVPFTPDPLPALAGTPVLLLAGSHDPLIPATLTDTLAELLTSAGATVEVRHDPGGHELSMGDLVAAQRWLEPRFGAAASS